MQQKLIFFLLYLLAVFLFACERAGVTPVNNRPALDWPEIRARGTLQVVTDFNSINYFIFSGRPMGFQYEMVDYFTKNKKLRFNIEGLPDLTEAFKKLENRDCDVIALNLSILPERENRMAFTDPLLYTRQVLVQKKPEGYELMTEKELSYHVLRRFEEMNGKSVFVHENSSFASTLKQLREDYHLSFNILEVPEKTEKLLELVSRGDIDYTVCDELGGIAYQNHYPNLDISMPLTDFQNLSWAVRKDAPMLLDTLNKWIAEFKRTNDYAAIFSRYYRNKYLVAIANSDLYALKSGKISNYDLLIKKYSPIVGWDWRLLASMIYLESRFEHSAESHAGAFGIMQLMPETGRRYGVTEKSPPEAQIRAGMRMMNDIYTIFKTEIDDTTEQMKFTLAAYNIGIGHIRDAQVIARKIGKNPYIWDDHVELCLLMKSNPVYYKDPDVKFGPCIGRETVKYVKNIMDLYNHYKNIVEK